MNDCFIDKHSANNRRVAQRLQRANRCRLPELPLWYDQLYRSIPMPSLRTVRRTLITVLLFSIGLLTLVGCDLNKINQQNFDKIKVGMAEDDVQKILGKPVENNTLKMPGGDSASKEIWKEADRSVTLTFINKKVTTIDKSGF
jgi:hypothetical protein